MRAMLERYKEWIHAWETRLTERDKNRVVSPLDWGLEWTAGWPLANGNFRASDCEPEEFLGKLNEEILAQSDAFYAYETPSDFHLEGDCLFLHLPSGLWSRITTAYELFGFRQGGAGRWWYCRSGMPTWKATTRSAASSTCLGFRRCA